MSIHAPPKEGLSTSEAFQRLLHDIDHVMDDYGRVSGKKWRDVIKESISSTSVHTQISWCSLFVVIVELLILFSFYAIGSFGEIWKKLLPEAFTLLFVSICSFGVVVWENYKRLNELPNKVEQTVLKLKDLASKICWNESNYPDLYMPYSPCISVQWCYRDQSLINLPWSLLVRGDLIILLPSSKVITRCQLLDDEKTILEPGTVFKPSSGSFQEKEKLDKEDPSSQQSEGPRRDHHHKPKLHQPLQSYFAIVLDTPYVDLLKKSLKGNLERPRSYYSREKHLLMRGLEVSVLPAAIMIFLGLFAFRLMYIPNLFHVTIILSWSELVVLQTMTLILPLLPLFVPIMLTLLHCVGNSKIYKVYELMKVHAAGHLIRIDDEGSLKGMSKCPSTASLHSDDTAFMVDINSDSRLRLWSLRKDIWEFFWGHEDTLHRSQKLLHVLSSVTLLSCVDKKGILSWPNPTADKVFILKTVVNPKTKLRETSSEVLDLTHVNTNEFELYFDESNWENYMNQLKPLGLNILLNNCNYQTRATYSTFHSHITYELQSNINIENDLVVPVTSRRCLCELSKLIGFIDKATDVFKLEQELCSYRRIESDEDCRDKLNRARIKFPLPHMMSVIVKEKACQTLQLMSQGTGDMVLDVCEEFWDGADLRVLTEVERKLILDFYQRSSLTSICAAFAYKPVPSKISSELAAKYMEMPPSKGTRYLPYYALSQTQSLSADCQEEAGSLSTDCLLNLSEKRRGSTENEEISNLTGCIDVQTKQIFLGMVVMQYEACMDMVQLVEQLDRPCIRFVHFSKENELRSLLFAEKMGLESGWNCHITLRARKPGDPEDESDSQLPPSSGKVRDSVESDVITFVNEKKGKMDPISLRKSLLQGGRRRTLTDTAVHGILLSDAEDSHVLTRCSASVPEIVMLAHIGNGNPPLKSDNGHEEKERIDQFLEESEKSLVESTEDTASQITLIENPAASTSAKKAFTQASSSSISSSDDEDEQAVQDTLEEDPLLFPLELDKEPGSRSMNIDELPQAVIETESSSVSHKDKLRTPTESYSEAFELAEHRTPLGFDMSNRAKLPRGIQEIRPHLRDIDNVPLLVSLFTDCTPDTTQEMLDIMHEYGEIILLIGASCNVDNVSLFLKADACIAVEPLYPQQCQKHEVFIRPSNGSPAPSEVGVLLTGLPCPLSLRRQEQLILHQLMAQARHFMNNCIRGTMQFWLSCQLSIVVLGLLYVLMLLPPLFTLTDVMWLVFLVIPILSLTMTLATADVVDPEVMQQSSWKNKVTFECGIFFYTLWFCGMRFFPTLINIALMTVINLTYICGQIAESSQIGVTCSWVYPVIPRPLVYKTTGMIGSGGPNASHVEVMTVGNVTDSKCTATWSCGENAAKLLLVQQFSLFVLVFYFTIISSNFLYRSKYIWVQNPLRNKRWLITSIIILVLHTFYGAWRLRSIRRSISFDILPLASFGWALLWAPVALGLNELLRWQEIEVGLRFQKRSKLEFGTKLGMNSPF